MDGSAAGADAADLQRMHRHERIGGRSNGERSAAAVAPTQQDVRLGDRAVDQVSLDVPAGAFVSLLGPSGSGKTTTLNLIAGFLAPDAGDILLDERSIADVPPHKRNIGMVFQSYSLFPHMTVTDNVGFPLRMRTKLSRADARRRIAEMLALVQLGHLGDRYPRQLSGGQQQRVAMARALVSHPRLLLMDEPLGALDKKLREQMQVEIKRIHRSVGTTVVYVTHDQTEALTMSDLVVVMHQAPHRTGRNAARALRDAGQPVRRRFPRRFEPARRQGAWRAAGERAGGRDRRAARPSAPARGAVAVAPGDKVVVLIRPEDMSVDADAPAGGAPDALAGTIRDISYHGDTFKLDVAAGGDVLKVKVARAHGIAMSPGERVMLRPGSRLPRGSCRPPTTSHRPGADAMTALAAAAAATRPRRRASGTRWLSPRCCCCRASLWIGFFFLLPLGLMCWRSLASEGFSLEPYERAVHLAALHQGDAHDGEDRQHRHRLRAAAGLSDRLRAHRRRRQAARR